MSRAIKVDKKILDFPDVIWLPEAGREMLGYVKEFKELIYVLNHILAGMPKRGSEEDEDLQRSRADPKRVLYALETIVGR